MTRKKFNPAEWNKMPNNKSNPVLMRAVETSPSTDHPLATDEYCTNNHPDLSIGSLVLNNVEDVIKQIEDKQIDLTSNYQDWCNIGFAFADEFLENGRELFHRVSKFHLQYDETTCNQQFNKCLKSTGHGITVATFFHMAKQAELIIPNNNELNKSQILNLPNFPNSVFDNLPSFLQKVVKNAASNEERDIMLLGAITVLSACIPNVYGIYDEKQVYANLFLFVTAKASGGKGRLSLCKQLVDPIHNQLREQAKDLKLLYDSRMIEYNNTKQSEGIDKPPKPPLKMLFIPANNSSTGMFQILYDNEGEGLIFETEGDTLSQTFKSDYGNYSDGFRKAFHHETISYFRRKDNEYVEIEKPKLSALLSGTPNQIANLIPSSENGLFSRFIFYWMNIDLKWKNVFDTKEDGNLEHYFNTLAEEYFQVYSALLESDKTQFVLSKDQSDAFNTFFKRIQFDYIESVGLEYLATIRRLGLISFRIAMIFSVLRISETGEFQNPIVCQQQDFEASLRITEVLLEHSKKVYLELMHNSKPLKQPNLKQKFLAALPNKFNRQQYLDSAKSLSIIDKTADNYIAKFSEEGKIHHESHNNYTKLAV